MHSHAGLAGYHSSLKPRATPLHERDARELQRLHTRMNRGAIALGLVTIVAGGTVFFVHHNQKKDRQVRCCAIV